MDYFRRWPVWCDHGDEIRVRCDESVVIIPGPFPNLPVIGLLQADCRERECNREIEVTAAPPIAETGSRQEEGSTEVGAATGVGGEAIDVRKISLLQIRMLIEDLFLAHSGAQPAEHVPDSNTEATDAGFPAPLPRLDRDPAYCGSFHFKNSTRLSMPSLPRGGREWAVDHYLRLPVVHAGDSYAGLRFRGRAE